MKKLTLSMLCFLFMQVYVNGREGELYAEENLMSCRQLFSTGKEIPSVIIPKP
jgi:hypothetical protein